MEQTLKARITTGQRNICIGYGVGPTTNDATDGYKLYMNTMGDSNGTGSRTSLFMVIKAVVIKTLH